MITKKDIGKEVRLIDPGEKHAGKHFMLIEIDNNGWCGLMWLNKFMQAKDRYTRIINTNLMLIKPPKSNWFRSLRKHMKIKWGAKGYWDWNELKKGGK